MDLRKLLKAKRPASAQLRTALADQEVEQEAAEAEFERLRGEYADSLVFGTPQQADQLDAALHEASRRRDRAAAAVTKLQERLAAAEEQERQGEIDALHRRTIEARAEGVRLIRERYPTLAAELVALAARVNAIEAEVAAANRELEQAGDSRRVDGVDATARPEAHSRGILCSPLVDVLRLPLVDDAEGLMWPENGSIFLRPVRAA